MSKIKMILFYVVKMDYYKKDLSIQGNVDGINM
jgi:hypothetical protein